MLTEVDKAYLAGMIDGEGCISIAVCHKKGRNYFRLILGIYNNDQDLIDWISDTLESIARTSYVHKRSRTFRWEASGSQAQVVLREMKPYLKVKKQQAELALAMSIAPYGGASRNSYSEEEESFRGYLREQVMLQNRKNGNKGSYHANKNLTQKEVKNPLARYGKTANEELVGIVN